jgi:spore coat polysaccharide biosynthesis protein SpsF
MTLTHWDDDHRVNRQTSSPTTLKMGVVIQARMGSIRLPGKTMRRIAGQTILGHVIDRMKSSKLVKDIYVATTTNEWDNKIVDLCNEMSIKVFRGSEIYVLERLYFAGLRYGLSTVVRITADNPLVGPDVLDFMLDEHIKNKNKLTTNYHSHSFPNGTILSILDIEVLKYLYENVRDPSVMEHIITDLARVKERFKVQVVQAPVLWRRCDLRYCVDNNEDLEVVSRVIKHFRECGIQPSTADVIQFLDSHTEVKEINKKFSAQGY